MLHKNWMVPSLVVMVLLAPEAAESISGETFKKIWLVGVTTVTKTTDEAGSLIECLALCLVDNSCDFVRYDKVVGPTCDFIEPSTLRHIGPDEDGERADICTHKLCW